MALDGRDNKSLGLLTPYILQIQMLHNQRDSHDKDDNNNKAKASLSASNTPLFKDVTPCLSCINRIHKDKVLYSDPASIQLSTLCKY